MTDHLKVGREAIATEAAAIARLEKLLDESFNQAVEMILAGKGKIVVSGVGKSGLIGRKLAATLSSTGTPAVFLHPTDAIHGDFGIMAPGDILIAISNSGRTDELLKLIPTVRSLSNKIIAIVGDCQSSLAEASDICLDVSVEKEACPLGLTPTASTTAAMVMGDALAVALLTAHGFDRHDFAASHPGGMLGARLTRSVREIMHRGDELPIVPGDRLMPEVLTVMNRTKFGVAIVVDGQGRLAGIITDGDLRRLFSTHANPLNASVGEVASPKPRTIAPDASLMEALRLIETAQITALIIVDAENRPVGLIHIHDVLGRTQLWQGSQGG
jgi:arabinose-5-phosphate isomerase